VPTQPGLETGDV